jgi:hypothetical protein
MSKEKKKSEKREDEDVLKLINVLSHKYDSKF